jgi:hypothetical protein
MRKKSGIELSVADLINKNQKARELRDRFKKETEKISAQVAPLTVRNLPFLPSCLSSAYNRQEKVRNVVGAAEKPVVELVRRLSQKDLLDEDGLRRRDSRPEADD